MQETAENLNNFIENKIDHVLEKRMSGIVTKDDFTKLDLKIIESTAEILKWMFICCVAQVTFTIAYILLYLSIKLA